VTTSFVPVGRVIRPQGNRGEVVVLADTDFADERFAVGARVYAAREGGMTALTVRESREHDGRWVVGFEGVSSIDAAETLRNLELSIPEEELRPLAAGAYYVHDLLGCDVWTASGARVGVVGRVQIGVGIPMLVLDADGDEVLIPLVDHIVRRVSVADRRIEIDPPEGLIELNRRTGGAR